MAHPPDRTHSVHRVQFYENDTYLVEAVARFVGAGLGTGDGAIVIAPAPHRDAAEERLRSCGLDLDRARREGRYLALDAAETLAQLVVDGNPDEARFAEVIGRALARVGDNGRRPVRAFGEMVALLWKDGNRGAALRLEAMWNGLLSELPLSLLCAYPIAVFDGDADEALLLRVCDEHSDVMPAESYAVLATEREQAQIITQLQHKARVLETTEAGRRKVLDELATLYQTGRALSAELDIERLLQALTDAATQLSGARFGAFFSNATDDQGSDHLPHTLSGGSREAFEQFGMPGDPGVFASTFAGEGVIRLDDVRRDPRCGTSFCHDGTPAGQLPVISYLAVPVVGRTGEVFGGLFLGHPEPAVFTEEAERAVVGLAAQAAVAIDNARLYDAERRARGEAEAANHAKDEFLAMLGHELRNPLSAVQNAVVTARLDPSRRDRALDIAGRGADQLGRLVDDLLDVARITQGRITLRMQRLPLASVVERAVETARPLIDERAHVLAVSMSGDDLQVEADSTRLEQVIVNLINNAAKYTDPGGRITVTAGHEGGEAVLRVRDNGIGIRREMLPRVFDLFAQADRALDRTQGGLGIGLTVVKRLVDLHGGRVEAYSDGIGRGAELVVRLPAVLAARQEAPQVPADATHRGCASILIVEDNADAAESLMMLLELLGHRVGVASDGSAALDVALASAPDVMLVDIGLPGMDGYEVARRARKEPGLRQTVLVALTGYGRDEDRQRAFAAGFDYHLVKPVNPDALQGLVARLSTPSSKTATVH